MTINTERVLKLQVAEVMSHEAISVSANATMAEAARILCEKSVSGVPVVDEMGHCVGVLSTKDFAERAQCEYSAPLGADGNSDYTIVLSQSNTPMRVEQFREDSVRRHMQTAVQTVSACTSVIEAARIMTNEHIHRLVVLDETSHPVGVASSLDLLKALVDELIDPCEANEPPPQSISNKR